ncbi:MAG: extracellular solute-binding protein [Lachnospiraceae bacterium]|nr:extracellular solute-binding protein [Lachnospiraceae bacterium]
MIKKKVSVIVILSLMLAMLAGCRESQREENEKVVLTYATLYLDVEMEAWISEWNKSNVNCHVDVKEYGESDYETSLMQFNADIVSGHMPDIIDFSDLDMAPYISKGILMDLYPYMDSDLQIKREDFVPGVLQLYEKDEKLYSIALGYSFETLMGKKSIVGNRSQWNILKMKQMIEEMPSQSHFIDNLGPIGLLRIVLMMGMDEYIDWETGQCFFEGDEFIELLELANSMEGVPVEGNIEEYLVNGRLMLNRAYISSVSEYIKAINMFQGEEVVCVGYPSAQGGKTLIQPYLPIGISNMCENKSAAWEFVRSLISEEFQNKHIQFNFPILEVSLEEEFEQALHPPVNSWSGENTDVLPSQEEINELYETINCSSGKIVFDTNIWRIIEEETEFYFSGEKNVEEVTKVIQNRVQNYIYESYSH